MSSYDEPFRRFAADIRGEARKVGARGAAVMRATAARIEADAKLAAPVDTGNLRSSISSTASGDVRTGEISIEVGPTADYGIYVELGTSRARAQPYLFPAADRHEDAFYKAMAAAAEPDL